MLAAEDGPKSKARDLRNGPSHRNCAVGFVSAKDSDDLARRGDQGSEKIPGATPSPN